MRNLQIHEIYGGPEVGIEFLLEVGDLHPLMLFRRRHAGWLAAGVGWSFDAAHRVLGRSRRLCLGDFHLMAGRRAVVAVFRT
jgi:hypothetical protein